LLHGTVSKQLSEKLSSNHAGPYNKVTQWSKGRKKIISSGNASEVSDAVLHVAGNKGQ
jgi:hypothetical protein